MRLFLICSKSFYNKIPEIKQKLETSGHVITLPTSYDNPLSEDEYRNLGKEEYSKWKAEMFKHSTEIIENNDAVLVLNFEKNGVANYIGGATFLEMYDAFRMEKKIYIYNDIPEGILHDEIIGFDPEVINGDVLRIR